MNQAGELGTPVSPTLPQGPTDSKQRGTGGGGGYLGKTGVAEPRRKAARTRGAGATKQCLHKGKDGRRWRTRGDRGVTQFHDTCLASCMSHHQPTSRPPLCLQSPVRVPMRSRGRAANPSPTHAIPKTAHANAPDTTVSPPHNPGQNHELGQAGQRHQEVGAGWRGGQRVKVLDATHQPTTEAKCGHRARA